MHAGTEAQKERYLFPLLAAEEIWCQLFSEPDAGSDLANLSHPGGARRRRVGGQRPEDLDLAWPRSRQFGILIARTDPDVAKHQGISYFICPMDTPGIEIRPIIEMTGVGTCSTRCS